MATTGPTPSRTGRRGAPTSRRAPWTARSWTATWRRTWASRRAGAPRRACPSSRRTRC